MRWRENPNPKGSESGSLREHPCAARLYMDYDRLTCEFEARFVWEALIAHRRRAVIKSQDQAGPSALGVRDVRPFRRSLEPAILYYEAGAATRPRFDSPGLGPPRRPRRAGPTTQPSPQLWEFRKITVSLPLSGSVYSLRCLFGLDHGTGRCGVRSDGSE